MEKPSSQPYVVLARKYRPQVFGDLIGQNALVLTLKHAFEAGRIAQAYMLTGVRGVGKTTTARILARALNFAKDGAPEKPTTDLPVEASAFGRHCADIMASRHPDVIEMDAASNTGVDNIREIIESARYKPLIARYKVFIIDEVHMLSKGAFNALLKTLEEPPEHVKFIFATTEIRKVPVTVLSRCQRFDLRRVDIEDLLTHFKMITKAEGAKAQDDALRLIACAAQGSVRDGLSILDQAIAFQKGDVKEDGVRQMLGLADQGRLFDLLEHILSGRVKDMLDNLASLHKDGCEPTRILEDLAQVIHVATRIKAVGDEPGLDRISKEDHRRTATIADKVSIPLLARAWQMLLKGIEETNHAPDPISAAEMVLIRMTFTADLPTPNELIKTLGTGATSNRAAAPADNPSANKEKSISTSSVRPRTGELRTDPATTESLPATLSGNASNQDTKDAPANNTGLMAETPDGTQVNATPDPEAKDQDAFDPLQVSPTGLRPKPASFEDVLTLIGERRDAKLKVHLEEHVSLVKFDVKTSAIDLHLLPAAPKTLANELREKLNAWTGTNWIIMLSKEPGAAPIAEIRAQNLAAEIAQLKTEPAIKAAFEAFPDAKIVEVTPLEDEPADDDNQTGTA